MTHRRLYVDGVAGVTAIYDTVGVDFETENEPLTSPLSHIPLLHFHSDLQYPAIIGTYTGSVILPAVSANNAGFTNSYTVATHGRGGTPYVEGKILVGSIWVPLAGHVPVRQGAAPGASGPSFARFLALGANGTTITLNEYSVSSGFDGGAYASESFSYVVWMFDKLVA